MIQFDEGAYFQLDGLLEICLNFLRGKGGVLYSSTLQAWKFWESIVRIFHYQGGTVTTPGGVGCCMKKISGKRLVGATFGCHDVLVGYKSCARSVPRFAIIQAHVPGFPGVGQREMCNARQRIRMERFCEIQIHLELFCWQAICYSYMYLTHLCI